MAVFTAADDSFATMIRWAGMASCVILMMLCAGAQDSPLNLTELTLYRSPGIGPGKTPIRLGYITGSQQHIGDMYYRKPGQAISGAITKAINEVNADNSILPNHSLEFVIAETYGQELDSIRLTAVLPHYNISAYIGPQETCIHEGRIAASYNLPMISYYCAMYEVSDKALYPTFTRTKPHDSRISMSVVALLRKYNWRKVVFVYSSRLPKVAQTITATLEQHGINVTASRKYEGPYFHDQVLNPFAQIVSDTYQRTRIYLMLGEYFEFVGLMVALYLRGLLDTGEYFVVGVDIYQYDPNDPARYLEGLFKDSSNQDVVASFRSFLGIAPAPPLYPDYGLFERQVNEYLEAEPFNFINPYRSHGRIKKIRPEAAFLYDAVWLYARAAHQAVVAGILPSNGSAIAELIKGARYKSAMGYSMSIDANGDAEGNFTVLTRRYDVEPWNGTWGIYPIGIFALNQNMQSYPLVVELNESTIDWVSGRPPVDEPKCGFFGERCTPGPNHTTEILAGVLGGLAFVALVILVMIYRNWRYEQELASLLWKIDHKDIELRDHTSQYTTLPSGYHNHAINRVGNGLRSSMMSLSSQADFDLKQVFTQVGTYKKSIVAIRMVHKRSVDLTREVRKELKIMRDIRHDNLNPFIGACVDPGHVSIVTEYCSKGSLQDILANDDVKLDNMFIASLIFDIIKGMMYLHDSLIRSHGRLKSANCVVDSRWVLKITDYGLFEFKSGGDSQADISEHAHFQNLLWTSPELLRDRNAPPQGTQKGDIYSFGIILYEIHGRAGPYGDTELSPKEIISRVIYCAESKPYRPRLGVLGAVPKYITDTITDCWQEDPLLRPDLKVLRNKLKPMQKGMKPNIFDNMMAIMEKYATNLEALVDEKTDQLREEKKRTDELLHQMLPRSVAEQLKQGKSVEAETYECVTIYFSDICGFTAMSSESTPMQVVELLSDLYTAFDSTIEHYDVYKVETIGDAYMVVSGLPSRNGIRHAGEIASMSLHLLATIKRFKIRHRPQDMLKLRIGIHSGSCVAGVVGHKMPRYCLFGDTVNTASRMESNGLPIRIHCSESCKLLLDELGGYETEERGMVAMKGKGEMRTFWVVGEDKEHRISRLRPPLTTGYHSPNTLQHKLIHKVHSTPTMRTSAQKINVTFDLDGESHPSTDSNGLIPGLDVNFADDSHTSFGPFRRQSSVDSEIRRKWSHQRDRMSGTYTDGDLSLNCSAHGEVILVEDDSLAKSREPWAGEEQSPLLQCDKEKPPLKRFATTDAETPV